MPPDVFFQVLTAKSIKEQEDHLTVVHAIASEDWRSPIFAFLTGSYAPTTKHEMERMNARTKLYSMIISELYRSGTGAPVLKCINKQQGIELLNEIHVGSCGAHRGPHAIAHGAMRQGFNWSSAAEDTKQLVRTCKKCQMFAKKQNAPANPTKSIIPTWPL